MFYFNDKRKKNHWKNDQEKWWKQTIDFHVENMSLILWKRLKKFSKDLILSWNLGRSNEIVHLMIEKDLIDSEQHLALCWSLFEKWLLLMLIVEEDLLNELLFVIGIEKLVSPEEENFLVELLLLFLFISSEDLQKKIFVVVVEKSMSFDWVMFEWLQLFLSFSQQLMLTHSINFWKHLLFLLFHWWHFWKYLILMEIQWHLAKWSLFSPAKFVLDELDTNCVQCFVEVVARCSKKNHDQSNRCDRLPNLDDVLQNQLEFLCCPSDFRNSMCHSMNHRIILKHKITSAIDQSYADKKNDGDELKR